MKTNATLIKSSLLAALLIILIMSCNAQKPRKIEKEFKRAAKEMTNARYNDYSRYDEKTFYQYRPYSQNKTANDDLLDYPLVNLQGDTTSIREQEGWVLLNFWTTGCGPCIEHLKEYAHEIDSLGYRVLEKEEIKILAIEHKSDDMELIAKRAQLTNSKDIMYSGKGIGATINLPALGYYYLISPDKEIVYETGDLGDYSEIIGIIEN